MTGQRRFCTWVWPPRRMRIRNAFRNKTDAPSPRVSSTDLADVNGRKTKPRSTTSALRGLTFGGAATGKSLERSSVRSIDPARSDIAPVARGHTESSHSPLGSCSHLGGFHRPGSEATKYNRKARRSCRRRAHVGRHPPPLRRKREALTVWLPPCRCLRPLGRPPRTARAQARTRACPRRSRARPQRGRVVGWWGNPRSSRYQPRA